MVSNVLIFCNLFRSGANQAHYRLGWIRGLQLGFALLYVLLCERLRHEPFERDALLIRCIGHHTGLREVGALHHRAVDKTEPATIERIEQFEFYTRSLIGDEDIDMSLTYQTVERLIVRIGHKRRTGACSYRAAERFTWIPACDNERIASISEDLFEKIAHSLLILGHRKVAVIEDIVALARKGTEYAIAVARWQQDDILAAEGAEMCHIIVRDGEYSRGTRHDWLITAKLSSFDTIVEPTPARRFGLSKSGIIVVLYIVGPNINRTSGGVEMFKQGTAVKSFEQYGIIIGLQTGKQLTRLTRLNDIGPGSQLAAEARTAMVVMHLLAQLRKLRSWSTAVCIAVKVDLYASLSKSFDAIKDINDAAVIGRPRNVEGDNMEMCSVSHNIYLISTFSPS